MTTTTTTTIDTIDTGATSPAISACAAPPASAGVRPVTTFEHARVELCCEHFDPDFGPRLRTLGEVSDSTGLALATIELLVSLGLLPIERENGEWMVTDEALADAGLSWRNPQRTLLLQTAARLATRNVARVHGSAARWRHAQYLGV